MLILLLAIFPFLGIGANLDAISSNSSMSNSSSNINSIQQDLEWESYKAFYAKVYAPHEEVSRRSAWESNQKIIAKHNLEAGQAPWAEMSSFWDAIKLIQFKVRVS
jgi:hypothetical protein